MKIKSIYIRAFRCFEEADIDFSKDGVSANLVAIQAPNGFGKTSLLDAIEFGMTNRIERFEKANYKDDNVVDKKLRDKKSFLHNKECVKTPIKISIGCEDGARYGNIYTDTDENLYGRKNNLKNEYFRSVILSQDWFSEFVSATDPENRYEIFLKYFYDGDDIVSYRFKLKQKINALNAEKNKTEKRVEDLDELLSEPVTGNVKNEFEKQLTKLEEQNIVFPTLSELTKDNLNESIVIVDNKIVSFLKNQEKLDSIILHLDDSLEGKSDCLSLSQLSIELIHIKNEKIKLKRVNEELEKQYKLKQLRKELSSLFKVRMPYKIENDELNFGLNHLISLHDTTVALVENGTKQKKIEEEIKILKGKEATLCNEISQGTKKRQSVMGELKSIDSKLSSLEDDYARFQSELQSIAAKDKKIQTIIKEIDNARNRITKLSSRRITLSSYVQKVNDLDFVLMSDDFFPDTVVALKNNVEKRKQQKGELAEVEGLISGQKDYQNVVRKLIIDVQNVNSVLKDGVCPVCGYDYKSQEELLQRIEANNILDDSIKNLLGQKQRIVDEIQSLSREIQNAQTNLLGVISNKVEKCNKLIYQLKDSIVEKERAQVELKSEIETQKEAIQNLSLEFKDFSLEQLRLAYMEHKSSKEIEFKDVDESIRNKEKEKNTVLETVENKQKSKDVLLVQYSALLTNPEYLNLSEKLKQDLRSPSFSSIQWKDRLEVVSEEIKKLDIQTSVLKDSIQKLEVEGISEDQIDLNVELKKISESEIEDMKTNVSKTLSYLNTQCEVHELDPLLIEQSLDIKMVKVAVNEAQQRNAKSKLTITRNIKELEILKDLMVKSIKYMEYQENLDEKNKLEKVLSTLESELECCSNENVSLENYINDYVNNFFDLDLINRLYNTIDPHPDYKKIKFSCNFDNIRPKLSIVMRQMDKDMKPIVPNLYFSTAQINILSFCIFLAKALHAKNDKGEAVDCIFIDDPIQSLDDINILSLIDLLRNLAFTNKKQIILTTHDKNFYELLKRKMPANLFNSKFLKLYERGKVTVDKTY